MILTQRERFIIFVSNDMLTKSDAIVFLEGDGYNRIEKVVELYRSGYAPKIVFSGGITDYSYGSYPYVDVYPRLIELGIPDTAIIHESNSFNTRDQAIEVVQLAQAQNWNRLILVASHYHQYRAYLTFLKVLINTNSNIILYNAPSTSLKWFEKTEWGQRADLLDIEFNRIEKYFNLNHLASLTEAIEYQKWKERQ